jgi:hypothetical protein
VTQQSNRVQYAGTMFRGARRDDFESIIRLYRQLQPADPVTENRSDLMTFKEILATTGLRLFVLEVDGIIAATTYLSVVPKITRSASPYGIVENVVGRIPLN